MIFRLVLLTAGVAAGSTVLLDSAQTTAMAALPAVIALTSALTPADREWGGERAFIVRPGAAAIG